MRVGIDIGGTKSLAVALDADGAVRGTVRLPSGFGADAVVDAAVEALELLAAEVGTDLDAFDSIGIGIPGMVDHRDGVVRHALNLGIDDLALGEALAARLGRDVDVENDVNVAALGVASGVAGGAPAESLAYLNLGTGLAAGLVRDGRLWRGSRGAAGEIGHVPVDPSGPECQCGQRGCLEAMASGSGIARQWGDDPPTVERLLARLDAGDEKAVGIVERLVFAVASAVRLLVLADDPARVVIGGGLAEALGPRLLEPVVATLVRWERASPLLAELAPSARVEWAPYHLPFAAIGAALAAGERDG